MADSDRKKRKGDLHLDNRRKRRRENPSPLPLEEDKTHEIEPETLPDPFSPKRQDKDSPNPPTKKVDVSPK